MAKKYVLTGSAYSGKSSVLNALGQIGFATVPETATIIISEQLEQGGDLLPWVNLEGFIGLLLEKQLELEAKVSLESEIAFIDRGITDELAYFRYGRRIVTPEYQKLCEEHRYDGIFLLETLPGYRQDKIRREPLEMVQRLRVLHEETYKELGYDVVVVPVMPILERVNFVIDRI